MEKYTIQKDHPWWTRETESPLVNTLLGIALADDLGENTIELYAARDYSPAVKVGGVEVRIPYNKTYPSNIQKYGSRGTSARTYTPETLWSEARVDGYDKAAVGDYFLNIVKNLGKLSEQLKITENFRPVNSQDLLNYRGKTLVVEFNSKQYNLVVKDQ